MLISPHADDAALLAAAAVVHVCVSLFWGLVLASALPRKLTTVWAVVAAAAIAVLDLRAIGRLFPEILALAFWPQFADHLAFGAVLGFVLQRRRRKRRSRTA
jgi:hypothetical protein